MKTYDESGNVISELDEINTDFIHTKHGYCYFEMEPGKFPIVFNLFIHPEYRKQGHAKKLLEYVINEIRQSGYMGEINIEAAPRQDSISFHNLAVFYMSMGLTVTNLHEAGR